MMNETQIKDTLERIQDNCPSGFAIAFHIKFTTPDFLFQTYDKEWSDYYSQHGLVMKDPVVMWGFTNLGTARWSDFSDQDPDGVMKAAEKYGIVYGAAFALEQEGSRSFAGFARDDREFTDEEIEQLSNDVRDLHLATCDNGQLSEAAREQLHDLSLQFTHPERS